jgi:uncharacterized protein (TIGR02569 family)
VLRAFGLRDATARPLPGGRGRAWAAGDVVLKPVDDVAEATWLGDVLSGLVVEGVRVERPVRSGAGGWVADGWSAWRRLAGRHDTSGRWDEVLRAGERLSAALRGLARPAFLDARTHAWAVADRVAWGEEPPGVVHEEVAPLAERLAGLVRPAGQPGQVVHGDLTANVLFAPGRPPGVIDVTPYWRPAAFCPAVVAVDALLWYGAPVRLLDRLPPSVDRSLLARAALRRLVTSDRLAADEPPGRRAAVLGRTVLDHARVLPLVERFAPSRRDGHAAGSSRTRGGRSSDSGSR